MIPKSDIPALVEFLLSGNTHSFEFEDKPTSVTDAFGLWYLGWPRKYHMGTYLTAALEAFNAREWEEDPNARYYRGQLLEDSEWVCRGCDILITSVLKDGHLAHCPKCGAGATESVARDVGTKPPACPLCSADSWYLMDRWGRSPIYPYECKAAKCGHRFGVGDV